MAARDKFTKITTPNSWAFSDWYRVGADDFTSCCDCGLVHHDKYVVRVYKDTGAIEIWRRTRRHVAKTKARRNRKAAKYPCKPTKE